MPDLWQFIDEIDADKQAMAVKRLEDRAQIPKFAAIRENYFDKIGLPLSGRILELGCGTGAVCRAIASRPGFVGTVVGSDLSAKLIEVAKDITANLGLKNIEYFRADGQGSTAHHGQFDLVLAHTVISVLQAELDHWIEAIDRALSENTFFASCNYVTYGMVKAS